MVQSVAQSIPAQDVSEVLSIYRNVPLSTPDSIRLLTFNGILDGVVNVSLRVVRLSQQPRFCALSYTWHLASGLRWDPIIDGYSIHNKTPVICNGQTVGVFENLANALKMLAGSAYAGESFWIDYICIDQKGEVDPTEQGRQVSIMAWIYSLAHKVVAWLDSDDSTSWRFRGLLSKLAALSPEQRHALTPSCVRSGGDSDVVGEDLKGMVNWRFLARFYSLAWFGRAWVVQEVLNARQLVLFYGAREISWSEVVVVSDFLSRSSWAYTFHEGGFTGLPDWKPNQGGPAKLEASRQEQRRDGKSSILYSLIRYRRYGCADERDKVFSLIGSNDPTKPISPLLTVDYQLSSQQVYIRTAKYILETTDDLLLLAHCEGNEYHPLGGLPTWVPDWSAADTVGLGITGYKRFNAALDRPRYIRIADSIWDPPSLEVEMVRFDTIAEVGEKKLDVCRKGTRCSQWLDILFNLGQVYVTGEDSNDVLWRTLITNTAVVDDRAAYPAPQYLKESFTQWLASVGERRVNEKWEPSVRNSAAFKASLARTFADIAYTDPAKAEEYASILSHTLCLRLFRTERGYLGVGTSSLKVGQTVSIVAGSRVPLVFESWDTSDNAFGLVGGCYVHGIMSGEALAHEPNWEKILII